MKRILFLTCIVTLTLGLTAFGAPKGGKGGGKPAKGGASVHAAAKGGGHGARQAPAKMSRGHANVSRGSAKMSRGSAAKMSRGASASRMHGSSVATKSAKGRGGNKVAAQRGNGKMRGAGASSAKMHGRDNVAAKGGRGNAKAFRNDRGAAAASVANANAQAAANGKVRGDGKFNRNAAGVAGSAAVTGDGRVVNQTVVPGRSTIVNNWAGVTGPSYTAFRDYRQEWHDRGWYDSNYTRVILVTGGWGWWFWNSGYWYPAWGYDPYYRSYPYDGPIYGYRDLTPDQIVITVQRELRNDGYYAGAVDGVLGPQTRRALAAFQADHGLAVTSAVDEPTLATLGLT